MEGAGMSDLYFIGAEGLDFIKVGRSKNPEGRLRSLRSGSPYKLKVLKTYANAGDLEPYILTAMRERVPTNGEWFLQGATNFDELVASARTARAAQLARLHEQSPTAGVPLARPTVTGFGMLVKQARKAMGWKQQDLREATGITQKYLSRIETDKADPGWSVVVRIAKALHMSLEPLLREDTSCADILSCEPGTPGGE
jgi:DNA-binding XRE family transcriptional regulator